MSGRLGCRIPWNAPQVGNATLERYDAFKCSRQGGAVERVQLDGVTDMPSLQQLLAAGLPQPSQLRRLGLFNSMLSAPALLGCPFLGPLTELILSGCTFSDGGAAPALEALLQQAPRLQNLSLVACLNHQPFPSAQPFPPALVSRTGLQRLSLQINDLADLPPGPYLSSEWGGAARVCMGEQRGHGWQGAAALRSC